VKSDRPKWAPLCDDFDALQIGNRVVDLEKSRCKKSLAERTTRECETCAAAESEETHEEKNNGHGD